MTDYFVPVEELTGASYFSPKEHVDAEAILFVPKRFVPDGAEYKGQRNDAIYGDYYVFNTLKDIEDGEAQVIYDGECSTAVIVSLGKRMLDRGTEVTVFTLERATSKKTGTQYWNTASVSSAATSGLRKFWEEKRKAKKAAEDEFDSFLKD